MSRLYRASESAAADAAMQGKADVIPCPEAAANVADHLH